MKALLDSQNQTENKTAHSGGTRAGFSAHRHRTGQHFTTASRFSYLSAFGAQTKEEAVLYRDQLGAREAMIIWPDFVGFDTQAAAERTLYATARAVGLRAKLMKKPAGIKRCPTLTSTA